VVLSTGEVSITPAPISDLFIENALDSGSADLRVDGSSTPVDFKINAITTKDILIDRISFYGGGNNVQYGQFLSKSSPSGGLANGIELTIKSDRNTKVFPLIKRTEDFKNKFASTASDFSIDIQPGKDQFLAMLIFKNPFLLKKASTDFVQVKIQDDLDSGLAELEFIARGVRL